MSTTAELVRLEIPAKPAFVGVARTVVVAIAASVSGIGDDRLEDLRIAVSEACTNAVEAYQGHGDHRVVLRCNLDEHAFEVRIEDGTDLEATTRALTGPSGQPPSPDDPGWGMQLIEALVDDVSFEPVEGGSAVRLSIRRAADLDD